MCLHTVIFLVMFHIYLIKTFWLSFHTSHLCLGGVAVVQYLYLFRLNKNSQTFCCPNFIYNIKYITYNIEDHSEHVSHTLRDCNVIIWECITRWPREKIADSICHRMRMRSRQSRHVIHIVWCCCMIFYFLSGPYLTYVLIDHVLKPSYVDWATYMANINTTTKQRSPDFSFG